eukprot:PhM_4_TR2815/c0_g1_i2/m.94086
MSLGSTKGSNVKVCGSAGLRETGLRDEEDACGTTLIQDDKFAIQKIIAAVRSLNGHRQVREGLLVERIESYGAAESVAGEEKLSLEVMRTAAISERKEITF